MGNVHVGVPAGKGSCRLPGTQPLVRTTAVVQFPPEISMYVEVVFTIPLVSVSVPFAVSLIPSDTPPAVFAMVRLLKVVELVPPIACAATPFKLTVLVLAVNVAPLLVKLRPTLCVELPALNVAPAPSVTSRMTVSALPAVNVPVPDMVKSRPTEMVLPEVAVAVPCIRKSVATVNAAPGIVFVPEPLNIKVP